MEPCCHLIRRTDHTPDGGDTLDWSVNTFIIVDEHRFVSYETDIIIDGMIEEKIMHLNVDKVEPLYAIAINNLELSSAEIRPKLYATAMRLKQQKE